MAKIYWTREVEDIMNNLIHQQMDTLFDSSMSAEAVADRIFEIRNYRKFAGDVISVMEALDRQEDEERTERAKREAHGNDSGS